MPAIINKNYSEIIECGNGILETVYIMLGGRKDPKKINEVLLLKTDYDKDAILKLFEAIDKRSDKIIEIKNIKPKSISKSEIELDLEVIKNILFYSYDLLGDAKASWRESFGGDAPEEYFFIARMGYTHWGMCVIELSKLFTDSRFQQFNLYSLLEKIDAYKNVEGVPSKVKDMNTLKFRDLLKTYEDENLLENLKLIRNKVFAHTDKEFYSGTQGIEVDYFNLERLQSTTFDILKEASEIIFDIKLEKYNPNKAAESIINLVNKDLKGI
jgi:hypothetical protein